MGMNWEEFRDGLLEKILHGANMKNVGGQSKSFSVRVQLEIEDQLDTIKELLPKDWHGADNASLKRAVVLMGVSCYTAVLESKVDLSAADRKKLKGVETAVANMCIVSKEKRIRDLERQADKCLTGLRGSDHPDRDILVQSLLSSQAALVKLLNG